jgi:hypothetical protein
MQHQLTKKCINDRKKFIPIAMTPILQQPDEDIDNMPKSYAMSVNGVDSTE